jgi:uncharacterized protein (TIGR02145 family)
MKKILFLFALLASITASATVTVTPLSVDYNTKTVKFSVSWDGAAVNDRVWVWIDLSPITGTSPGTFEKAVITGATATDGSIDAGTLNGRGFYVTNNPSTVTATLNNATDKFNWCVYGSDAPPNVTAANGTYTLYGTPPFILTAAGGAATQTVAATTIATSAVTITPVTLTDETGCPGVFCIYSGSDLFIDADHLCQTRATGAQNWEAWIKDTRDEELYRIVLMPDDKWWLAQNLKYSQTGSEITNSGCDKDKCGRWYTQSQAHTNTGSSGGYGDGIQGVCPTDWVLPTDSDWTTLSTSLNTDAATAAKYLRADDSACPRDPAYGWGAAIELNRIVAVKDGWETYLSNSSYNTIFFVTWNNTCASYLYTEPYSGNAWRVRCIR